MKSPSWVATKFGEKGPYLSSEDIEKVIQIFKARRPHPTCALDHHSPFTLLVGVVLSAQCTDKKVNSVLPALFAKAQTPQGILELEFPHLLSILQPLGLYKKKAQYLQELSRAILEKFQGEVPRSRQDLETLPGVGRKSAHVVLGTWFHEDVLAVDTHVFRVSQRLGLGYGKTPYQLEKDLMERLPKPWIRPMNHWIILHGREFCKARSPLCSRCPLRGLCPSYGQYTSGLEAAPRV